MMIVVSISLPLLLIVFIAQSTIAIRINKRYISNSNLNIEHIKDNHE